jgi:hypothetical protein
MVCGQLNPRFTDRALCSLCVIEVPILNSELFYFPFYRNADNNLIAPSRSPRRSIFCVANWPTFCPTEYQILCVDEVAALVNIFLETKKLSKTGAR